MNTSISQIFSSLHDKYYQILAKTCLMKILRDKFRNLQVRNRDKFIVNFKFIFLWKLRKTKDKRLSSS